MKKILSLITIFAIILIATTSINSANRDETVKTPKTKVFIPTEHKYKLVWEDNFDGNELDTTKWRPRLTGKRRIGYNDSTMIKVADGKLILMYDIKGDSVCGSMVGTQKTFMSRYGYYEISAKLQRGIGPWSAFWMQSPQIMYGSDPKIYGSEIDIFEYFKELGDDILTHNVWWAYGPNMQTIGQLKSECKGLADGFHTFGLEWTKDKYAFYIDGIKYHEVTKGVSQIKQYMILSVELPEKLQGIKNACAPDTFQIDYVRVYQKQ